MQNQVKQFSWLLSLIVATILVTGCPKDSDAKREVEFAIDKTFDRGPLEVHVRVDSNSISIAETLLLELEATISDEYTLTMPKIDPALQQFGLLDWDNLGDRITDNNELIKTYRYRLEPFLSGTHQIPSFVFKFFDINSFLCKAHNSVLPGSSGVFIT